MMCGTRNDAPKQILQKRTVALARIVKMASAITLRFDMRLKNTDLYTVKERIDYHGSRIDQASYTGNDC